MNTSVAKFLNLDQLSVVAFKFLLHLQDLNCVYLVFLLGWGLCCVGPLPPQRHHHHQEPVIPRTDSSGGLAQRPQLGQGVGQAPGTLPPPSR